MHTRPLKTRILKAGSWALGGQIASQALRFAGNLVMTRLLFPEAFGLMAIVQAVIMGVTLMSDVGIGPAIVQHKRGDDADFLNTAWTLQIVMGILVWIAICILTPVVSWFYHQPSLNYLLPVVGLSMAIGGFNSTKLYTANRKLDAARATLQDVGSYAAGLLFTIMFAWFDHSVWALVWGNLVGTLIRVVTSHTAFPGIRNHFRWDNESLSHLVKFGRWVMLSSSVTYFSGEGMRLLLAAMLSVSQLAFYSLASGISLMFLQVVQQIAGKVLFPAYSELHRESPERLFRTVLKARVLMVSPNWILALLFIFWGQEVIDVLYDARYHDAGPMLEILSLGMLVGCINNSYSGILMAKGMVAQNTLVSVMQVIFQIVGASVGYLMLGTSGVILGIAACNWLVYPITAVAMARIHLWQYKFDLPLLFVSTVVAGMVLAKLPLR